jgi:hypothetical protein
MLKIQKFKKMIGKILSFEALLKEFYKNATF